MERLLSNPTIINLTAEFIFKCYSKGLNVSYKPIKAECEF